MNAPHDIIKLATDDSEIDKVLIDNKKRLEELIALQVSPKETIGILIGEKEIFKAQQMNKLNVEIENQKVVIEN